MNIRLGDIEIPRNDRLWERGDMSESEKMNMNVLFGLAELIADDSEENLEAVEEQRQKASAVFAGYTTLYAQGIDPLEIVSQINQRAEAATADETAACSSI